MEPETLEGRSHGVTWTLERQAIDRESTLGQDIVDNAVVQTDSQRKFERIEQFEQGTVQSSTGGTAMSAGRPAPDSQMTLAAVAESATTSRPDRHGTIEDMDTCGAIVLTIDPEDRDGWTQQVMDRNRVEILDICLNHRR